MSADAVLLRTLLLSQSYEPIRAISWKRALRLLTLGKVEVLEQYDGFARSATITIKIPAVVRLLRAYRHVRRKVKFSRANIYARDRYTCQYCGKKKIRLADLTFDHVIPRKSGGKTTWENIVACCESCNLKKGGRTPREAGMRLLSVPVQPKWIPAITIAISTQSVPSAWRDYLYWTDTLDNDIEETTKKKSS